MTEQGCQPQARPRHSPSESAAWVRRADVLAAWAMDRLVNRADAFGAYVRLDRRGQPGRDGRPIPNTYTAKRPLDLAVLSQHFRGAHHHHVVGLHSTSTSNTCRWGAFDVDRHGDSTDA